MDLENLTNKVAFDSLKENHPELFKTVNSLVREGKTAEDIINLCMEKTGEPYHRLAFIGCAADYMQAQIKKCSDLIEVESENLH